MIPKKLHYCWFGHKPYPALVEKCMDSWKRYLSDYEWIIWNESNSPMDIPVVKAAYKDKNWAFVSDYVRVFALKKHGGVYLDTDVEVIKDFDPLLKHQCFLGFSQRDYVNNAVMGGVAEHIFFNDILSHMNDLHTQGSNQPTSPRVVTAVLKKYGLQKYGAQELMDVNLLPQEAFYPYNPFDPNRPLNNFFYSDVKADTFAVHHYMASWNRQGLLRKLMNRIRRI